MPSNIDYDQINREIIAALDIITEYKALGVRFDSDSPRASGKIACYAIDREDRRPSAWVDCNTGRYGDSATGESLSLWDFAAKHGSFSDWKDSREHYAIVAGVNTGAKKKSNRSVARPSDKFEFIDWDKESATTFCSIWVRAKGNAWTVEAFRKAGGQMAYWPCSVNRETGEIKRGKNIVAVLPCYGPRLLDADPVAYVAWEYFGKHLEIFRGKDNPPDLVKMVSVGPTSGALMNRDAIAKLMQDRSNNEKPIRRVFKTAGPSDMLTLMSMLSPDHDDLVITNPSGESGDVPAWNGDLLAGHRVGIIHDADKTGRIGESKWLQALHEKATEVRGLRPFGEVVAEKSGKDFKDWATDPDHNRTYSDVLNLWSTAVSYIEQGKPTSEKDNPLVNGNVNTIVERERMKSIGIDVLGKLENLGACKIFSRERRRTEIIKDVSKLTYEHLIMLGGQPIKRLVLRKQADVPDMLSMDEVRESMAMLAGERKITDETELGVGCWLGRNMDGSPHDSVLIVGVNEAAELNGSKKLKKIDYPICRGHLIDFDVHESPWYDFEYLSKLIGKCEDVDFRMKVMNDTVSLFKMWHWKHNETDPVVVAGLVFATWVQSLWEWRPQVCLTGASNSGKTSLCLALNGLFGNLCKRSSDATAAAIRQAIGNSSCVMLYDEFDAESKHQREQQSAIQKMLRSSGRGDTMMRGTSSQKSQTFRLRHIVWLAGIQIATTKAADRNRAVNLELLPPLEDDRGKLVLPSARELAQLGQHQLAVAIWAIREARKLAIDLKETRITDVNDRVIESYSVPASILAVISGQGESVAVDLLETIVEPLREDLKGDLQSDEVALMSAIMFSQTRIGPDQFSVGQLVDHIRQQQGDHQRYDNHLQSIGVRWYRDTRGSCFLAIHCETVTMSQLRNTKWGEQAIDQILRRISNTGLRQIRISGARAYCILVPVEWLDANVSGDEPGQKTIAEQLSIDEFE